MYSKKPIISKLKKEIIKLAKFVWYTESNDKYLNVLKPLKISKKKIKAQIEKQEKNMNRHFSKYLMAIIVNSL